MRPEQLKVAVNFLNDCAKIIFGSLVIGVFLPNALGKIPWITFITGLITAGVFFFSAFKLARSRENYGKK